VVWLGKGEVFPRSYLQSVTRHIRFGVKVLSYGLCSKTLTFVFNGALEDCFRIEARPEVNLLVYLFDGWLTEAHILKARGISF
jgi:hypothetical protein